MSRKATIAAFAAALMVLAIAPTGAQAAEKCPPGTPSGPYCVQSEPGLSTQQHTTAAEENGVILFKIHCFLGTQCKGTLYFQGVGNAHGARAAAKRKAAAKPKTVVYATEPYSIKAGATVTLHVHLDPAGRAALARNGQLTVKVIDAAKGTRKQIATLHIKAARAKKHKTSAHEPPGFTG